MTRRLFALPFALALTALVIANPAHDQTVYTTDMSFMNAVTLSDIYEFEGSAFNNNDIKLNPPVSPLSFTVTGGDGGNTNIWGVDRNNSVGNYSINGTDSILAGETVSAQSPAVTRLGLGAAYTGAAFLIGQDHHGINSYDIRLFNGETQVGSTFSTGTVGDSFYGLTSITAFDNIRITTLQGLISFTIFDNVIVGTAKVVIVPEPGSIALLGIGLIGGAGMLGIARRRNIVH